MKPSPQTKAIKINKSTQRNKKYYENRANENKEMS